jgi:hypothetical protein
MLKLLAGGHMNRMRTWALAFLLAGSVLAFERKAIAEPGSAPDSVKIVSISPDQDTALRVGERVTFKVEVEYNLTSASSGSITLVIQQGESGRRPLANETQVVQKGKARLVLRKDVEVPDTTAIQVFTPLAAQGGTSTSIVDTRIYRVVKR